jgi:hypothetical protein
LLVLVPLLLSSCRALTEAKLRCEVSEACI